MVLAAITLLIQILPVLLQSAGVISPAIADLIKQLGATIPGLITALATGKSVPADTLATLQAAETAITALKADTSLSPADLQLADSLTTAITAAIQAEIKAGTVDDPSTLTELPTNL